VNALLAQPSLTGERALEITVLPALGVTVVPALRVTVVPVLVSHGNQPPPLARPRIYRPDRKPPAASPQWCEVFLPRVSRAKNTICRERLRVVSYRVPLDVPGNLILFVSGLLALRILAL